MDIYLKETSKALPAEICQKLIGKFMKDPQVEDDPQPDYSTRRFLYLSDKADWFDLMTEIQGFADQLVASYFEQFSLGGQTGQGDWFDDGFVLAHYRPGDRCILHDDGQNPIPPNNGLRLITLLFYLNDVSEGGETFFPVQNQKIQPEQGKALIFPALFTHPHEVLPATTDRFILQTWITDPSMEVNWRNSWDEPSDLS